jgi:hypothetical protein
MNADKKGGESGTHLDFMTCTIERRDVGSTPGSDLITRMRTVSSVADAGCHGSAGTPLGTHAIGQDSGLEESREAICT